MPLWKEKLLPLNRLQYCLTEHQFILVTDHARLSQGLQQKNNPLVSLLSGLLIPCPTLSRAPPLKCQLLVPEGCALDSVFHTSWLEDGGAVLL